MPLLVVGVLLLGTLTIGTAIAIGLSDPAAPGSTAPYTAASDHDVAGPQRGAAPSFAATWDPTADSDLLVRSAAACLRHSPAPTTPPAPRPGAGLDIAPSAARHPRHLAVFLGDSYTSGYRGVGEAANGWPARVGASFGWQVRNLAVPGIGFVNPGWTSQPIGAFVAATIAARPSIVIVAAGHNDYKYGTDRVADAADAVLERIRAGLPNALLVVVGPIWHEADVPDTMLALRDHLRVKAGAVGAKFIDPISGRWLTGPNSRFIGTDAIHPTTAGYRHLATTMLSILRADARFTATQARVPTIEPVSTPTPLTVAGSAPWAPAVRLGSVAACAR